ncbi:tetraspanin-33-like [Diadema antillarum]|uniref:tetraspanin-33-like n=1 Tax=Diadema antillarum TaxID=105358 RepID=UPI003A87552B
MASPARVPNVAISPCVKYTLYVLSFLFWLICWAVCGIGIWALVERGDNVRVTSYLDFFTDPAIVMVVVGGLGVILNFAGFVGALRENCCLLTFFYLSMILIFILEVTAGILAFAFSSQFYTAVDGVVEDAITNYRTDGDVTNFIDYAQRTLECCGGDGGYRDWSLNRYFNCTDSNPSVERCGVPYSCCRIDPAVTDEIINTQCGFGVQRREPVEVSDIIYTIGCIDKFLLVVNEKSYIVGLTIFGIALLQLLVMLLAFILCRQIEKEFDHYAEIQKAKNGVNRF